MRLTVIDRILYVAVNGGFKRVDMEVGDDPIRELLARGVNLNSISETSGPLLAFDNREVFDPPIRRPSKIVCVGLNYLDHCREAGVEAPSSPITFSKHPSSLVGNRAPIVIDSQITQQVDYEIELAVVIGRRCRDVSENDALDVIAGYTIANDVSARDLQHEEGQWVRAKSFDSFCPLGPYLVTPDEIKDPQRLTMRTVVSGVTLQDSSTSEMIFPLRKLISHVTRATTFEPGDLVLTGTPWGTGAFRQPSRFLSDGDTVRCEITGLGELSNAVVDLDAKRQTG